MTRNQILDKVDSLNVWRRGGQRAPHKPLLLLLALSRLSQGQQSLLFSECEEELAELIREFGPTRVSYHPEYPFCRLRRDGIWQVTSTEPFETERPNGNPSKAKLREVSATGSFPDDVRLAFLADPSLLIETAQRLLSAHFPESFHQDILDAVGLSLENTSTTRRPRDPRFRIRVLVAYEYRCALCGLDLRIGNMTIALEAAHIQWHQAGGPDTETNGVALCSLHHKIFDLGAFTIHTDHRVLVSELAHGAGLFEEILLRHHGQRIRGPSRPEYVPSPKYLAWHRREVFKEGARFLEGVA